MQESYNPMQGLLQQQQGILVGEQQNSFISTSTSWAETTKFIGCTVLPKREPLEERNNDSGVSPGHYASSSESPRSRTNSSTLSPMSINSEDSNHSVAVPCLPPFPLANYPNFKAHTFQDYQPFTTPDAKDTQNEVKQHQFEYPHFTTTAAENNDSPGDNNQPLGLMQNSMHGSPDSLTASNEERVDTRDSTPCSSHHDVNDFPLPMSDETMSNEDLKELHDENGVINLKTTQKGSKSKQVYKCKECNYYTQVKEEWWEHLPIHIPPEKRLCCPFAPCKFITKLKHHMDYHVKNHTKVKPFKCEKCSYTCVNKSMLNSHLKSHSNVYQYTCSNCAYASKHQHTMKMHLRKYNHNPGPSFNADGSPNPNPIDVKGRRRGPRKVNSRAEELQVNGMQPMPLMQFGSMNQQAHPMMNPMMAMVLNTLAMNTPFHCNPMNPMLNFQMQNHMMTREGTSPQELCRPILSLERSGSEHNYSNQDNANESLEESNEDKTPLDLTKFDAKANTSRRKGLVKNLSEQFKDDNCGEDEIESDEKSDGTTKEAATTSSGEIGSRMINSTLYCHYCDLAFGNDIMFTVHQGYHGYKDPFTCNLCGCKCDDKVNFFLHICRVQHP